MGEANSLSYITLNKRDMKKVLVIIIVGLSGVIGYLMDQNIKLKQENDELFMENVSLEESVESLNQIWLDEYEPTY